MSPITASSERTTTKRLAYIADSLILYGLDREVLADRLQLVAHELVVLLRGPFALHVLERSLGGRDRASNGWRSAGRQRIRKANNKQAGGREERVIGYMLMATMMLGRRRRRRRRRRDT